MDAGDGVDLLIVKHLCELLSASLEVEAQTQTGRLRYRVTLPARYGAAPAAADGRNVTS